ncbi:MAG: nucleotidyltransferase domain-containing protein [Beijerinckiaceae bacterium]
MSTSLSPPRIRPNIGIFTDEEAALAGVVARLVEVLDPQAIWLFGSRARGDHRPDSDFDLLVVAKPGQNWGEDYRKVYMAAAGFGVSKDIIPCSAKDFVIAQLLPTTLVSQVLVHGRKLFEAETGGGILGDRPSRPEERSPAFQGVPR